MNIKALFSEKKKGIIEMPCADYFFFIQHAERYEIRKLNMVIKVVFMSHQDVDGFRS